MVAREIGQMIGTQAMKCRNLIEVPIGLFKAGADLAPGFSPVRIKAAQKESSELATHLGTFRKKLSRRPSFGVRDDKMGGIPEFSEPLI
jgi:hypothetical protein